MSLLPAIFITDTIIDVSTLTSYKEEMYRWRAIFNLERLKERGDTVILECGFSNYDKLQGSKSFKMILSKSATSDDVIVKEDIYESSKSWWSELIVRSLWSLLSKSRRSRFSEQIIFEKIFDLLQVFLSSTLRLPYSIEIYDLLFCKYWRTNDEHLHNWSALFISRSTHSPTYSATIFYPLSAEIYFKNPIRTGTLFYNQ